MSAIVRFLTDRYRLSSTSSRICLLLAAITIIAFWRVMDSSFLLLDDDDYITKNPIVLSGLSLENIQWALHSKINANWHPLTWISLMADQDLFGLSSEGTHAVNLLLHVLNVLLLFWVLNRVTKSQWKSAFVAALFAIHPLHVESVAWAAERKDVLSSFFWMLTMLAYAYYAEKPSLRRQVLVIGAFGLGIMAKPMLVTLPFVLLLMDVWPLHRLRFGESKSTDGGASIFELIWEKLPLFALSAFSVRMTYRAQFYGGAVIQNDILTPGVRAANAVTSCVAYLHKMVWPSGLAAFYPHPENHLPQWQVVGSIVLLVIVTIFALRAVRRRPYLTVGWLWYLGTLVPVIGLVQVGSQAMADRYTYIPLIGIFIMIAWGVPESMGVWEYGSKGEQASHTPTPPHSRTHALLLVPSVLVVLAFMVCTWVQVGYWQDDYAMTRHAIAVTKDNYEMHVFLGVALQNSGDLDGAIVEYREVIRTDPDIGVPHNNLAVIYMMKGDYKKSWDEVYECQRCGYPPDPSLLDQLSRKMPMAMK